jgi:hypothetical protein
LGLGVGFLTGGFLAPISIYPSCPSSAFLSAAFPS